MWGGGGGGGSREVSDEPLYWLGVWTRDRYSCFDCSLLKADSITIAVTCLHTSNHKPVISIDFGNLLNYFTKIEDFNLGCWKNVSK